MISGLVYEMIESDGETKNNGKDNTDDESKDTDDESKDTESEDDKYESYNGNMFPTMRDDVSSLVKICLKNISENFERFNLAYTTTEDTSLRRNFTFLQRVYSQPVFLEATRNRHVKDSSLNFVFNEYLKEVNFKNLSKCSPKAVLKRLTEIGQGINSAVMNAEFVSRSDGHPALFVNEALGYLPNINVLHISCSANDETVQIISSCCLNLRELYLDDCNVTDEGVKSLCPKKDSAVPVKCPLKLLSLRYTNVGAAGVTFLLENMPSLETLLYHNLPSILYSMHKNDEMNNTLNADKKYNLTTLDLINYPIDETLDLSNILKVWIKFCPHIKDLHIKLEEKHLELIAQFKELEKLYLECISQYNQKVNLNNFLTMQGGKLTDLTVSHASFSVSTLIKNCPKLKCLSLKGNFFLQGEDCNTTSLLNNLHELHLRNFIFSEPSVEMSVHMILNCSPKLENLYLYYCEIAHSEINTKIVNFCARNVVKKLSFNYSDVRVCFLESILLSCSSLETLIIHDCDYIHTDDISSLYTILHSKKDHVNIIWNDDRSELYSLGDSSDYEFHDSDIDDPYYDYYGPDDFDYNDADDFDDEDLVYGYDYD